MENLTLRLLRRSPPKSAANWHRKISRITDLLVKEYGTPSLGNFRDPVKEIFYIHLSAKTTEALYTDAHAQLYSGFRTLEAIAKAPVRSLLARIGNAGLGRKRSRQVKQIASRLLLDLGSHPGRALKNMTAEEAYDYLTSLPGIGPKSAFCVMMYSLGFDVFPVDAHVQRVLRRIGVPQVGAKHYHAQEQLPAFIPEEHSKDLHVSLVLHGRRVCKPVSPKCDQCVLNKLCLTALQTSTTRRAIRQSSASTKAGK